MAVSTALLNHDEHRVVPCILCRSYWEERLVGVGLLIDETSVGDLCPRCLRYTPRQNATWLREYSELLRQAVANLNESFSLKPRVPECSDQCRDEILKVVQSTARLQEMTAFLRRGTRDLKNHFSRARRLFDQLRQQSVSPGDDQFVPFLNGELNRMDQVLSIGPQLLKLPEWQTTVEDLMRGERESLVRKFSFQEQAAEASVARRYREFMLKSA